MTTIQLTPTPRRAYGCTAMSEYLPCPRCSVRTTGARNGLRGAVERRVVGCDHCIASPAQAAEIVERDEDQLPAGFIVALAEQRHARREVKRLRTRGDVIIRGTERGHPPHKVGVLSKVLDRRHCPPVSKTLFPALRLRINPM